MPKSGRALLDGSFGGSFWGVGGGSEDFDSDNDPLRLDCREVFDIFALRENALVNELRSCLEEAKHEISLN